MRYGQIRQYDIANGPGVRVSIFVTGCSHNCKNCFNEEYQDFSAGHEWTEETTDLLINYLKDENISGLTLLGGEPMENLDLIYVIKRIRKSPLLKEINIWVYSGYTYEQIIEDPKKKELLDLCDVLVDGEYIEELKDLKLKFRGSSNQRIIDLNKL